MFRPTNIQMSMPIPLHLPPVLHLKKPDRSLPKTSILHKSTSVQVLDEVLHDIIASVEPSERTEFFELLSNTSSARKGVEHLMINNLQISSLSVGSSSDSMEALISSPLSGSDKEAEIGCKRDTLASRLFHRQTPPRARTSQTIPNINKLKRHLMMPIANEEAISNLRPRRQITVKHYSDATPSMHCHICCRSSKNIKVYACARIKEAICRKVVCSRCFIDNNWVHHQGWVCSHCRGICPSRSQCFTYGRSNLRRKLQATRKKLEKSQKFDSQVLTPPTKLFNKNDVSGSASIFMPHISLTEAIGSSSRNDEISNKAIS